MANEPSENVGTRLMFENERVRVWDLALAPGESMPTHIHRDDYLFIVVNGGDLRHIDRENPDNDKPVRLETDRVVFNEANGGTVHNELLNVGDTPYRNFIIELKAP
jgi:predicted metal-dependent enzyme (double-stranded beta helix superfamily)